MYLGFYNCCSQLIILLDSIFAVLLITVNQEVQAAKEMLLMATSADEQKMWVQQLSKKVSRKGIGQITSGGSGDRAGYVRSLLGICLLGHCF